MTCAIAGLLGPNSRTCGIAGLDANSRICGIAGSVACGEAKPRRRAIEDGQRLARPHLRRQATGPRRQEEPKRKPLPPSQALLRLTQIPPPQSVQHQFKRQAIAFLVRSVNPTSARSPPFMRNAAYSAIFANAAMIVTEWRERFCQLVGISFRRNGKDSGSNYSAKCGERQNTMSTKKLAGKVAVVTGASKGIGASIAEHMAAEGAAVVVNYASSKAGTDATVKRITQKEGRAVALQADVSKPEDIRRLFAEAKKAFGKIDILVNDAGVYEFAPLEAITPEHFHKQYNLNVLGLILATQEAVKYFGPEGGGHQHKFGGGHFRAGDRFGV